MRQASIEVIEPDLSFRVMAILFKVHNKLGNKLQEKYYQRAIAVELKRQCLHFEQEKLVPLLFENEKIGHYKLDFIIEDKIILEIKTVPILKRKEHE